MARDPAVERGAMVLDELARRRDGTKAPKVVELAPPAGEDKGGRRIFPGGRARALAAADQILGQQEGVFQRNGALVLVAKMHDSKTSDIALVSRDPDSLLIHRMTPEHVLNILAREPWLKFDKRSDQWVPTDYPQNYARGVVSAIEWTNVRPLTAIIGAPTLDTDMNLIEVPGYHAGTGLLLATSSRFAKVPDSPTKDEAIAALNMLRDPFAEFPWARRDTDPEHATAAESAHLAAIVTPGVRHILDTAPAIGYDAPRRGTGKTLLADAIGTIWHGTAPAHANYAKGDDEFRKMIASCLVAGDQIVMIDNVDRPLRSAELCNALTTTRYSDRRLGHTERYVLDARVTWLLNGNNLVLVGDLARRVIISRIDAEQERPETRTFRIPNLLQHIAQHRHALVPAALTIVKAFALANPPRQATPLGSFERWSRMIREALIWLDMPDPCETTPDSNEGEPETQAFTGVLSAWRTAYGESARTAPDVATDALESYRDQGTEVFAKPELRHALEAALGGAREITARNLGYYLRKWQGVVADGLRLRRLGKRHGGHTAWRLEERTDTGWR